MRRESIRCRQVLLVKMDFYGHFMDKTQFFIDEQND